MARWNFYLRIAAFLQIHSLLNFCSNKSEYPDSSEPPTIGDGKPQNFKIVGAAPAAAQNAV